MAQVKRLIAALFALCLFLPGASALADRTAAIGEIPASALPGEARAVLALIKAGGPFAYAKDGSAFGNREKMLPLRSRGYYREYTVRTPGGRDRGARRIVAGAGKDGDVRTSGEYYFSNDHYNSFRRIRE